MRISSTEIHTKMKTLGWHSEGFLIPLQGNHAEAGCHYLSLSSHLMM